MEDTRKRTRCSIIFKKLKKGGEPITVKGRTFQKLILDNCSCVNCVFNIPNKACYKNSYIDGSCLDNEIWVETKQNKENMKENNDGNTPLNELTDRYVNGNISYDEFEKEVKSLYSCKKEDMEEKKIQHYDCFFDEKSSKSNLKPKEYRMYDAKEDIPNFDKVVDECLFGENKLSLKPFDLEDAKAGKLVCTRDGRKVKIIYLDAKGSRPIVALVTECDDEEEVPYKYHWDGSYNCQSIPSNNDLMMYPEKKEGWVNLYTYKDYEEIETGIKVYNTEKEAKEGIKDNSKLSWYLDTIKITWEE